MLASFVCGVGAVSVPVLASLVRGTLPVADIFELPASDVESSVVGDKPVLGTLVSSIPLLATVVWSVVLALSLLVLMVMLVDIVAVLLGLLLRSLGVA